MSYTQEQYNLIISLFFNEEAMSYKMFDSIDVEIKYIAENGEINEYLRLEEVEIEDIIKIIKAGDNCFTKKYSDNKWKRFYAKFSKRFGLQKIKKFMTDFPKTVSEKIKNMDEDDVKGFLEKIANFFKIITFGVVRFFWVDDEKITLTQMIKYKQTLQRRLNMAKRQENEAEVIKLTRNIGGLPSLNLSEYLFFGFKSLSWKKKILVIVLALNIGKVVLVSAFLTRVPHFFYLYILAITVFFLFVSRRTQEKIRDFVVENPEFQKLFWEDLLNNKTIKNVFYHFYYAEETTTSETLTSPIENENKVDVEESEMQQANVQTIQNPYASRWEEFFNKVLKKHIEEFKIPEYIPFKTTEIHIFDMPTLSTEELEKNNELIENFLGKRIYKIYKDYNGEIGKIGVEFETVELPKIVPLKSVPYTEGTEIVIGKSVKEWITWNLEISPHALVVGATGGGKSVTINSLINEMVKKGWLLYFVDFKGGMEFGLYKEKHYKVITERENFAEFTDKLIGEVEYRSKLCADYRAKKLTGLNKKLRKERKEELPRIVVFLDEYADVNSVKDDFSNSINSNIGRVLAKGRAVGIHLVIGTQRPDADTIGSGAFRDNIACRIIGKMSSESGWAMSLGVTSLSKEERIFVSKIPEDERKQGMFVVKGTGTMDGKVIVRTPFADDEEFENMVLYDWSNNPYSDYQLYETESNGIEESSEFKKTSKEITPLDLM